jgi:two-component system sensor histidine kinase HydH
MNRRLLILVTAPSILIGLLLLGVCLAGAWYVNRMQNNLSSILVSHVASMQAAQQLEINVRQLRFHSFVYLINPASRLLEDIHSDEKQFEDWLRRAQEVAFTDDEIKAVREIQSGYERYQDELEKLRQQVEKEGPRKDLRSLDSVHPIRHITDPCREYSRLNEEQMTHSIEESRRVSQWLNLAMLLLGIGGPLSGLLGGYGIARGLSRSLYRLSVRVQDMAHRLEKDVGAVDLTPEADWQRLDKQLDHVVQRVAEVADKLQRQQTEMLRAQQLAAVGQLAASVAHEVRNPLTSIKMLVEVGLRSQKPKPLTTENLKIVHGEILRLERTVQGFLDFTRPPALQKDACDVRLVIRRALDLVRARARQQRVELCFDEPPSAVRAEVDQDQICTVLVNLFINALDAMAAGGALTVRLLTEKDELRIMVTDCGDGIRSEIAEQLFTPFASTKPTGSGLGLTICKRIVEEHGGSIEGANLSPRGACFNFTLPLTLEVHRVEIAGHR